MLQLDLLIDKRFEGITTKVIADFEKLQRINAEPGKLS